MEFLLDIYVFIWSLGIRGEGWLLGRVGVTHSGLWTKKMWVLFFPTLSIKMYINLIWITCFFCEHQQNARQVFWDFVSETRGLRHVCLFFGIFRLSTDIFKFLPYSLSSCNELSILSINYIFCKFSASFSWQCILAPFSCTSLDTQYTFIFNIWIQPTRSDSTCHVSCASAAQFRWRNSCYWPHPLSSSTQVSQTYGANGREIGMICWYTLHIILVARMQFRVHDNEYTCLHRNLGMHPRNLYGRCVVEYARHQKFQSNGLPAKWNPSE